MIKEESPAAFAKKLHVYNSTVSNWTNATQRPELDKAILICELYDVTLDWLYRGSPHGLADDFRETLTLLTPELN